MPWQYNEKRHINLRKIKEKNSPVKKEKYIGTTCIYIYIYHLMKHFVKLITKDANKKETVLSSYLWLWLINCTMECYVFQQNGGK